MNTWLLPLQSRARAISMLAVCALLVFFTVNVQALAARLWPAWAHYPLAGLAALTALESQLAGGAMRKERLHWFEAEGGRYLLAEWGVLALLSRAAGYLPLGLAALRRDVYGWTLQLSRFFDEPYLVTLVFLALIWGLARLFDADLEALQSHESDLRWESLGKLEASRQTAREAVTRRVFGMGAAAAVCAALTRLESQSYLPLPPVRQPALWALVLFFAAGLFLMGQAYFALMRGRWVWERTRIEDTLPRSWMFSILVLFAAAGLLALLLPTHFSLGLLPFLWGVAVLLVRVVTYVFFWLILLFSLLMLPISWLTQWMQGTPQTEKPSFAFTPPSPPASPFEQTPPPWSGLTWWETARAVLFWGLVLILLGAAVLQFVRQNRAWWEKAAAWPFIGGLIAALRWLAGFLRGAGSTLGAATARGRERLWQSLRRGTTMGLRAAPLRPRSPRDRIFSFYQGFLQRMALAGRGRRASQTPLAFAEQVSKDWPEGHAAVQDLTDVFMQARYAHLSDEAALLPRALRAWRELRRLPRAEQK
ncbi:MAG: hypothetical protein Fur0018_02070 [Anaerolineales bacterium]